MPTRKIALTGAFGFIGSSLVQKLQRDGHTLLLVGRDPIALEKLHEGVACCDFEALENEAKGFDAIVHLADFSSKSTELLKDVIYGAKAAGIKKIINFTGLHSTKSSDATGPGNISSSEQSKVETQQIPDRISDIFVTNLELPMVYGDVYRGKLAVLNKVPRLVRKPAFWILAAFWPTVHIDKVYDTMILHLDVAESGNILVTDEQRGNPVYWLFQKLIDFTFVLFVVMLFWWLLLYLWIVIPRKSEGPALFLQERIGMREKLFTCVKFRTMLKDTRQAGTHEIGSASLAPMGQFLRSTKIDELPQVWNILKQEISLIGPRPCLPSQKELLQKRSHTNIFSVPSGITGWAQINDIDMSDPDKLVRWDDEYIKKRSIIFDLKILWKSVRGSGQGDRTQSS